MRLYRAKPRLAGCSSALAIMAAASLASPQPAPPAPQPAPPAPQPAPPAPQPAPPAPEPAATAQQTVGERLKGQAAAEFAGAMVLAEQSDFANAMLKFRSAYGLSKDWRILRNIAVCAKELHLYTEVLSALRAYLHEGGQEIPDPERKLMEEITTWVRQFVGVIKIGVSEAGATVLIDGHVVGTTPLREGIEVNMGARAVRVTKPGFIAFAHTETIAGGGEIKLAVALKKEAHKGRLVVSAGPSAVLWLNGKAVGKARFEGEVKSGGHTLRVTAPGMLPYQSEVIVQDNEVRRVHVSLVADKPDLPRWVWIAGGVLLVGGAAVGGALLYQHPVSAPVNGTLGTRTH